MIPFKEDFKPSPQYKPYLFITTFVSILVASGFTLGAIVFPFLLTGLFPIAIAGFAFILLIIAVFVFIWMQRYYNSIVYHLNDTEMTWKRGVWFKKTGIVPYNRITNIDISQGPVMRIFKISNLQIQTAGNSGGKAGSEISIIGMEDAEPLRAFIMDFVRGTAPVTAVTGGNETAGVSVASSSVSASDMAQLISEVAAIRKLLEEQNK
ncbi:hypothetical protein MmiEs2_09550 [Methanimicrococcus stummii]|uniref:YdbS-like PH domain-containing protein n=1 Tax=Methanimicrococcus stummii TaxID=3028294 RepID=A0AA96V8M2_9EURY|nr:PH domain-containing protein [Methanimicrococcus sp. Es2]WNY28752.1 hypothetical protein MmiEs2_09550 [Methanimicrococcus sp. Es2]